MRKKILLLGSGELGKELVISMQRLGQYVIAVDNYENAPAMQVAHESEVINMLDGEELDRIVLKHNPDFIVPEVESIRTERFYDYEKKNITVIPSAKAVNYTMNRKAIRDLASIELGLKTANYKYAKTLNELIYAIDLIGFPCVVKPLMSSSGKGQSIVKNKKDIQNAWDYAISGSRGDLNEIIIEAEKKEKDSNQILDFTREVKNISEDEKKVIIEALWKIIYSDENADMYETNLMRRLSGLLYLDSKVVGDLKEKVKKNL